MRRAEEDDGTQRSHELPSLTVGWSGQCPWGRAWFPASIGLFGRFGRCVLRAEHFDTNLLRCFGPMRAMDNSRDDGLHRGPERRLNPDYAQQRSGQTWGRVQTIGPTALPGVFVVEAMDALRAARTARCVSGLKPLVWGKPKAPPANLPGDRQEGRLGFGEG